MNRRAFAPLLLLLATGAAAAFARAQAPADTAAVAVAAAVAPAVADTARGSGTEDDPWFVDPDEALLRGYAIFLAEEDTFAFAPGTLDTQLVDAPRVRVEEVVRRIGERMAFDEERMGDHAWTQVTRIVARPRGGERGERDRTEYEVVERVRVGSDGTFQRVQLRRVERKYRDGALAKEETDDDIETDWREVAESAAAIPFALESAADYKYEIAARRLFGDAHLVYEVRYRPKSRFAALPSGTVWIDWSDFVIRRFEGTFRDAVPLPLFVRAIPWFRVRRVPCGGFWVVADAMARLELRRALPGIPASVELYVRTYDHVIGGAVCGGGEAAP